MRRFIHLVFLLPLAVEPACAPPDAADSEEPVGAEGQTLLASSRLLWPMVDGKATIRVCFLPLDIGSLVFPLPQFAPDLAAALPTRKQWIREVVEAEWNAKTPVQFVGWEDCGAQDADVRIQLISSQTTVTCGITNPFVSTGGSCVEDIGLRDKGHRVFINATWGDETLYSARYDQTVTDRTYDP
jgi:hypothetical protein